MRLTRTVSPIVVLLILALMVPSAAMAMPTAHHRARVSDTQPTAVSVSCSPQVFPVRSSTLCSVTVSDLEVDQSSTAPAGSVSFYSVLTNGTGSFAPWTCWLSSGVSDGTDGGNTAGCTTTFTVPLGTEGNGFVMAVYNGDSSHTPGVGSAQIEVIERSTSTSLTCVSPVAVLSSTTCTATVSDTSPGSPVTPSGTVTFSTSSATGTFDSSSCSLVGGSCSVTYSDTTAGTPQILANYGGTINTRASGGSFNVGISQLTPQVSLQCSPSSVKPHALTTCTVTVTSVASPTGVVTFATTSAGGVFTPESSCDLVQGSCSVQYADSDKGTPTITATYDGDVDDTSGSATFVLTVSSVTTVT